jgi:hypothetical protein
LTALAIFIICNCAGYLLFTFIGPSLMNTEQQASGPAPAVPTPAVFTQADVVNFVTPTATPAAAAVPPPEPTETAPPPQTPAPLLPTVTPILATNTPLPAALPPTATSVPTNTATPAIAILVSPTPPPLATSRVSGSLASQSTDVAELKILSHQSYVDSLGWHHIVGEVQNDSEAPVEFVEVMAKLYDATNELIGIKLTFTTPDVIFPGGKAPFDVVTLRRSQWERIEEYTLEVKGDVAESLLDQRLVLLNQQSYIQNDLLHITGEVQNTGDAPALVKLIITLYDAEHKVINTNWSYANLGVIPVDQVSPFEVKITPPADPNNFSYHIQIEEEALDVD